MKHDGATVNVADFRDAHDGQARDGGGSHGDVWIDANDFHQEITAAKPDRVVIGDADFSKEVLSYDAAATENAYASVPVPNDYGGEGELVFVCTANATTGNARVSGTVRTVARTGGAAVGTAGTALAAATKTVAGVAREYFDIKYDVPASVQPKPGETMEIKFSRIGGDGADTLAAELEVHGCWLRYRRK